MRTCSESGDWCDDPAARNGCLGCGHCDSSDRRRGKCPECFRGNGNIDCNITCEFEFDVIPSLCLIHHHACRIRHWQW